MKRTVFLILALAVLSGARAQSYSERFQQALDCNDFKSQRAILAQWHLSAPTDVELYIARWNYYVNGYMGEDQSGVFSAHDHAILDSGFAVIDQAIALYPERLELRMGKIYFLGQIRLWDDFEKEILRTLDHSEQICHRWTFNGLAGQGADLICEGVQDYQSDMFSTIADRHNLTAPDSAMVGRIRRVAHRTVQLFPSNVPAMNMLAVSYMLLGENGSAVKHLLRAEAVEPNNPVVLGNLVQAYTSLGQKKKAQLYQARLKALPQP